MTCNLGSNERAIRLAVGMVLIVAAGFVAQPGWGTGVMYVVGGVAMLTSLVGFCPAWTLFGFNTCKTADSSKQRP